MSDKRQKSLAERFKSPAILAGASALGAVLLTWFALSAWSWKLWIILGVAIAVFTRTFYCLTVSRYLRMANILLGALLVANVGDIGVRFHAYTGATNFIDFAYESSNAATIVIIAICFLGAIAADVLVKRAEIAATSGKKHGDKSQMQVSSASDGSVSVQNSPGAQVSIDSGGSEPTIPLNLVEKLVNTTREQASVIDRLIRQQDVQFRVLYLPNAQHPLSESLQQKVVEPFDERFPLSDLSQSKPLDIERIPEIDLQALAEKVDLLEAKLAGETAEDIAEHIREQLSIWNKDSALLLAERLQDHLEKGETGDQARITDHLFLLARMHTTRAEKDDLEGDHFLNQAKHFLGQIDTILSTSPDPEMLADIEALRGLIENIENGPDAALARLAENETPYAIRIRLRILLNKQDLDGALDLIDGRPPHLEWCELATMTFAAKDRRQDALLLAKWAEEQDDRSKYPQCIVLLAEASLNRALAEQEPGRNILPQDLSVTERNKLLEVLDILRPVLDPVVAAASVESELDTAAVKIAWQAHHLLNQRDDVAELARLMYSRRPVPTDVARSVISGYMAPPNDLPARLREDHPNDLDANILAAVVQSTRMSQHDDAFVEAKKLVLLADTDEKKEELFKLFMQLWQNLSGDAIAECEQIITSLITHNAGLQAIFDGARALRAENPDAALVALDKVRAEDDIFWLQLRSDALMQKGRLGDAVDLLLIAARKTGDPMLLHKTADLAFQAERASVAAECYERLLVDQPGNLIARGNLASLYAFHLRDIVKATLQFQALHEAEPDNLVHTVNLAICLAQLYQPEESMALYEEACSKEQPDLRALLGRAELHLSLGDPDAAVDSLKPFRESFWDDPNFLLASMNIAYAAGDEAYAHEAFRKLNQLRVAGAVDETAFKMVQTDEALEVFKKLHKVTEDRRKHLHTEMLMGRMPWVWAAQVTGDAVYRAWRMRTQVMGWIGDDQVNRACFSIYATNGFHARDMEDGRRALLPLVCPQEGTRVVADVSVLITLHRLGLLDTAADYFGEILVPEGYLPTILEDGRKMVLHQRSRQQTAERINKLVDDGVIVTLDQPTQNTGNMPTVDEDGDLEEHCYHLIDLIQTVYEAGLIDDISHQRISEVHTKPSSVDDEHPVLAQFQDVFIELSTLETLTAFGLVDAITGFYRVHVSQQARTEIRQRLDAIGFQEETRLWHFDLWNQIRNNPRFTFVKHSVPLDMQDRDADSNDLLAFFAYFVAKTEDVPLIADDRACQALTLNEREKDPYAAFGSLSLIHALETVGRIDSAKAAESILCLIQWRYRFMLPSVNSLMTFAKQFRANPPGRSLQEMAEYVHDCMRDAGLLGGPENTDLKDSIAMRLYLSWLRVIAEFLMQIWDDDAFSEDTAKELTNWSVREFLPSLPRVVHGNVKVRLADMTARFLLSHALINSNSLTHGERVPNAMKAIKDALKLSDDEYMRIVTGILYDTRRTEPQS